MDCSTSSTTKVTRASSAGSTTSTKNQRRNHVSVHFPVVCLAELGALRMQLVELVCGHVDHRPKADPGVLEHRSCFAKMEASHQRIV